MRVWLAEVGADYLAPSLVGIFTTLDKAIEACEETKLPYETLQWVKSEVAASAKTPYHTYEIDLIEVDTNQLK